MAKYLRCRHCGSVIKASPLTASELQDLRINGLVSGRNSAYRAKFNHFAGEITNFFEWLVKDSGETWDRRSILSRARAYLNTDLAEHVEYILDEYSGESDSIDVGEILDKLPEYFRSCNDDDIRFNGGWADKIL